MWWTTMEASDSLSSAYRLLQNNYSQYQLSWHMLTFALNLCLYYLRYREKSFMHKYSLKKFSVDIACYEYGSEIHIDFQHLPQTLCAHSTIRFIYMVELCGIMNAERATISFV